MKKKLQKKDRESTKMVIIEFPPDKENPKNKTLGLVQQIRSNGKIVLDIKPIVYKASFEGGNVTLVSPYNPKEFMKMIEKFESSEHEVLVVVGIKAQPMSKKQFNEKLESLLHKMVTAKYMEELQKSLKKGYIA